MCAKPAQEQTEEKGRPLSFRVVELDVRGILYLIFWRDNYFSAAWLVIFQFGTAVRTEFPFTFCTAVWTDADALRAAVRAKITAAFRITVWTNHKKTLLENILLEYILLQGGGICQQQMEPLSLTPKLIIIN